MILAITDVNILNYFSEDGSPKPLNQLTPYQAYPIKKLTCRTTDNVIEHIIEFESKFQALTSLGKAFVTFDKPPNHLLDLSIKRGDESLMREA